MKLTKNNVSQVLSEKIDLDLRDVDISRENGRIGTYELTISSKSKGINCLINSGDDKWEETLVNHIRWQLGIVE